MGQSVLRADGWTSRSQPAREYGGGSGVALLGDRSRVAWTRDRFETRSAPPPEATLRGRLSTDAAIPRTPRTSCRRRFSARSAASTGSPRERTSGPGSSRSSTACERTLCVAPGARRGWRSWTRTGRRSRRRRKRWRAEGEDLERALASLPEPFRAAVVLRDIEELSYEEIAEALQVPMGTVMSRIHRGRALLRAALGGSRP